jgi:hypothetical protein
MLGVLLLVAVCLPPHCQQALQPQKKKVMKKRFVRVQNRQIKTNPVTAAASSSFGPAKKKTKKKNTPPSNPDQQFVTPTKKKPSSEGGSSPWSRMPVASRAVSGSPSVGVGAPPSQFQLALQAGSKKGLAKKETQGQADAETLLALTKKKALVPIQDWFGRCLGSVFVCPVGMGFGGYAYLTVLEFACVASVCACEWVCVCQGVVCVSIILGELISEACISV